MKRMIEVLSLFTVFIVSGCYANKMREPLGTASMADLLAGLSDTVLVYDGASKASSGFVTEVNIKEIKLAIVNAVRVNKDAVWKGSFVMVANSGVVLRISYYGRFFSINSSDEIYQVGEQFSDQYNAFIESVIQNKIIPWRKLQNDKKEETLSK